MDEALKEFLIEGTEFLDQLEQDLLELESNSEDQDRINESFRALHTLKGNSGFWGFKNVEQLSHASEAYLIPIRDGEKALSSDGTSLLLEAVDKLRSMLTTIEETESDEGVDAGDLLERIRAQL